MTRHHHYPYDDVSKDEIILRDRLAADRTVLANERTLLAYIRTSLTLFIGGVTLVHFVDITWAQLAGWSMIPAGPVFLAWGGLRYLTMRRRLKLLA